MLTPEQIDQLAAELQQSEATRTAVEHFSRRHPGMTIEDGYRISRAWVARQLAQGRQVIGHKIGLTSRAMQLSSQIDEPDYGTLLDSMLFTCTPGEVLEIPASRFIAPRVEVELAFVLKRDLRGPHVDVEQVLHATDHVTPAIEIIDARIEQFDRHTKAMRKVFDTISDNAANAGIVVGAGRADARAIDRPWVGAILRCNGVVEETGLAAGVQGDLGYITRQKGMFSYSGLNAAQMQRLRAEFGVYGVDSGRICVAALNTKNIKAVAAAIKAVM